MASTTFVDNSTIIYASWLNDVNTGIYGTLPTLAPLISPSFTTPSLGVATATTINGVPINSTVLSGTNTGDQLVFKTISVSGQSDVVADTTTDTLTLVAGTGVTITTNASTDTITINSATFTAATSAEVKTGTDNTKAVTPQNLLGALGFSGYFQSADQTITSGGTLTLAHGLGRAPIMVLPFLKNVTAQAGYSTGDITPALFSENSSPQGKGVTLTWDTTNIYIRYGSQTTGCFPMINKSDGTVGTFTNTNWAFFVRVLA